MAPAPEDSSGMQALPAGQEEQPEPVLSAQPSDARGTQAWRPGQVATGASPLQGLAARSAAKLLDLSPTPTPSQPQALTLHTLTDSRLN